MSKPDPTDRRCWPQSAITMALLATGVAAQEADSPFAAATVVLPVDSAPFQRLFDFDGDGDLDAVGTRTDVNNSNAEVTVWRNDQGAYTLDLSWRLGAGHPGDGFSRLGIATGDFNGDGHDDFVVSGGIETLEYLWTAAGWQAIAYPMAGTQRMHSAAAGDCDGDGLDDFAIAVRTVGGTNVDLHLGTGAVVSVNVPSTVGDPWLIASRSNGALCDLLLCERTTSSLGGSTAWLLRYAGGQLQVQQTLTTALPNSSYEPLWMAGDIEGDGDGDIVVFRKNSSGVSTYQVFRNAGGSLVAESQALGGPAEYLADVDGDGDLDGVCCSGGGGGASPFPKLDFPSAFEIAFNDGAGFAPAMGLPGEGSRSLAGAADIDGDGDVDFVAGRCVFYGRGPWHADSVMPAVPAGTTMLGALPAFPPRFDDLDGDGDPDLQGGGNSFSWINRGDGMMTLRTGIADVPPPPTGSFYAWTCQVDFDNDGARDLLCLQVSNSSGQPEQVVRLRNNRAGHFDNVGPLLIPGASFPWPPFAADLDGDGDEDLFSRPGATQPYIFWNDNGTFVPGPGVGSPWTGVIYGVGDFNGDGIMDALMTMRQSTGQLIDIGVFRGTGNHSAPFVFAAPVPIFAQQSIAIGDLNGDGTPDVLTSDGAYPSPVVYFNTTTPLAPNFTFTASPLPVATQSDVLASIGDFDGDGRTDLAFTRLSGENRIGMVALLRTNAAIPTAGDYVFTKQRFDGAAVDFDGDGDIDLLGTYPVRNVRFHGPAAGRNIQDIGGSIGEGGSSPRLSAVGPFRTGSTERVMLRGLPGPSVAVLGYSFAPANMPDFPFLGTTLLVDPTSLATMQFALTVPGEGRGAGWADVLFQLPPHIAGFTFYVQFYAWDPTAPASITCSNRMVTTIGW